MNEDRYPAGPPGKPWPRLDRYLTTPKTYCSETRHSRNNFFCQIFGAVTISETERIYNPPAIATERASHLLAFLAEPTDNRGLPCWATAKEQTP